MKKWLLVTGAVVTLLIVALIAGLVWDSTDHQATSGHIRNDELQTLDAAWPGNAIDQRSRFMDERYPFLPRALTLLKWQLGTNRFKDEKENDTWQIPVSDPSAFLEGDEDGILWLGHATFYIRFGSIGILTDPIFDEPFPIKRMVPVASPLEKIRDVDYVLLSHDHRDHMDESTLRLIAQKFPNATFIAGLRSEDVLNDWKTPSNPVVTAGWYQQLDKKDEVKITFLPVRHWSRRGLMDTNWRLWGSYVIEKGETSIYFGGDSGYAEYYKEIGEIFPSIDYFLIGIGAYEPRFVMESNHNSPAEALKAFKDSGAKTLVPMHYGTFDLSDEPPSQPLRFLLDEADGAGLRSSVRPLAINESILLK